MKLITFFSLCFLSATSFADTASCTGKVNRILVYYPDSFFVAVGASTRMIKICSTQQQFKRIPPEACKTIVSLAMTARAMDKEIQVVIDNAPTTDCATIPDWFEADIRFFELYK